MLDGRTPCPESPCRKEDVVMVYGLAEREQRNSLRIKVSGKKKQNYIKTVESVGPKPECFLNY